MPAGDGITQAWQFEFNGLVIGAGTNYDIAEVNGLDLMPVREGDMKRPLDHGAFDVSPDLLPVRIVEIDLNVASPDSSTAALDRRTLADATLPGAGLQPLVFLLDDGVKKRINCRCRRRRIPTNRDLSLGYATVSLMFWAPDPRVYANAESVVAISLPVAVGGMDFPIEFPLSFGSLTSGASNAPNTGNFETRPVITFNGPFTSPEITNLSQGKSFKTDAVLLTGDQLVVDFLDKTVELNGSNQYQYVTSDSEWWNLQPSIIGANVLEAGGSGTGTINVSYRDAYVSAV